MTSLVFVLLLVSQTFSSSRPQCHHCDQTSCDCSRQNLTEIPAAPSKLITELDLSFNQLERIMKDDVLAYASLRSLIVNNNRIKTIQEDAFVPLINLEKLDLSLNQLDALSSTWFKTLFSLQYLNLLGNNYTTLGQGNLFQPLKRLKILHFGGPSLQSVSKLDFCGLFGLEELYFDGKKLQVYAEGSLRQIGPISHVTLGLNGGFQRNPMLVQTILSDAVQANTMLTVTDTLFNTESQMFSLKVALDRGVRSLTFKNVNMSMEACLELLNLLQDSNVTMLALEDAQFLLRPTIVSVGPLSLDNLEAVSFKNIDVTLFYRFPALNFMDRLINVVRKASVINCNVFAIPCESSAELTKLEFLDLSDNIISDFTFHEMMCGGNGVFQNLQTFNISKNILQTINSRLFTNLEKLQNIDMSKNALYSMPETCYWPANLQFLNLSSNRLPTATRCLPESLQILDLSNNDLTVFNIDLPLLTELHISGNRIGNLPTGHSYPTLMFFSIKNNNLQTFSSNDLHDYKLLKRLEAGGNPYVCSCDLVAFMASDLMNHRVGGEIKSYICDSPDAVRGRRVADVRLSVFECHAALAFSLLCSGILALVLLCVGLCYRFSVVWYMRMTCAWLRAKKKPKLKKGALEYDVFVSYSEMDSGWVEAHLVLALEQTEPPLRLCLHKRDFVPGGLIMDNIMDAIEKSHRTIFILSRHFVRSEWCKYELDYSHFRLFDQNDDRVILILLEPIDKKSIPKKFCRLRRLMNSMTYLEWPDDENHIAAFWESLRTAVTRPETGNENKENETCL
ncbi:toll-like receptor 2 [Stegastes partitus]|nr:PREDICTED: toll-like receptor 2 [Stegastes partitus]